MNAIIIIIIEQHIYLTDLMHAAAVHVVHQPAE
jgi:hypothetical protein